MRYLQHWLIAARPALAERVRMLEPEDQEYLLRPTIWSATIGSRLGVDDYALREKILFICELQTIVRSGPLAVAFPDLAPTEAYFDLFWSMQRIDNVRESEEFLRDATRDGFLCDIPPTGNQAVDEMLAAIRDLVARGDRSV